MQLADFTALSPGQLVPTAQGALAFLPAPAPRALVLDTQTIRLLGRAEHRLGTLSGAASRLLNPYLVGAQILRREAILSSRIEETIATPEQIALFELGGEPRTDDAREVGNFVRAMEHAIGAVELGDPITTRLILATHKILMTGVRGDRERPGEFRTVQNYIGRSTDIHLARVVPPPYHEVPLLLSDLERLMNEDAEELPTLVRIAIAHYQFETIGVTAASASAIITKLVNAGMLTEITGRTRDRVYVARHILDVMGDPALSTTPIATTR